MLIKTNKLTKAEEIVQFYNRFSQKYQFDAYGIVLNAYHLDKPVVDA